MEHNDDMRRTGRETYQQSLIDAASPFLPTSIPSITMTSDQPAPHTPTMSSPPSTIVLGLWPYATDEQIENYTEGYKTLYPSARLILLRHSKSRDQIDAALDVLWQNAEKQPAEIAPAVLLHVFGNTAASHACQLLRAFRARSGKTLPVRAVILDDIPNLSISNIKTASRSPHTLFILACFILWAIRTWLLSVFTMGYSDTASQLLRQDLNDPDLIPADSRKCYVWPEKNIMSSWSCLNGSESEECLMRDYSVKRSAVDVDIRWTGDKERYWSGIEDVWEGR